MLNLRRHLLISIQVQAPVVIEPVIQSEDTFVGKTLYCRCFYDGEQVAATWSITSGSQFATINQNGRLDVVSGTTMEEVTVRCDYNGQYAVKTITISYDNQLTIECSDTLSGTSATLIARYNSEVVSATWSIVSGSTYASISSNGTMTI